MSRDEFAKFKQWGREGGLKRAQTLSKQRQRQIARVAGKASASAARRKRLNGKRDAA